MDDGTLVKLKVKNEETVQMLIALGHEKRAERLQKCCSFIERIVIKPNNGGIYPWENKKVNLCNDKFCAICQQLKREKNINKYKSMANTVVKNNPHAKFYHITFTVENMNEVRKEDIKRINSAFKNLVNRAMVKKNLLGYHKAIEITYSPVKGYHPHIHAIFAFKSTSSKGTDYISAAKWTNLWKECMGLDYEPQVKIIRIPNLKGTITIENEDGKGIATTTPEAIGKLMYYMTKIVSASDYLSKSQNHEDNFKVFTTLFGATYDVKSITDTGIFRKALSQYNQFVADNKSDFKEKKEAEDSLLLSSPRFEKKLFRYSKGKRKHIVIEDLD